MSPRLLLLLLLIAPLVLAVPALSARDAVARTGLPQPAPKRPLARSPRSHRVLTHTRVCVAHDRHGRCTRWALTHPGGRHPPVHAPVGRSPAHSAKPSGGP
jgi:hypothetical protein